jgi:hypothetical protein
MDAWPSANCRGAALAADQDGRIGRRDPGDRVIDRHHRRTAADDGLAETRPVVSLGVLIVLEILLLVAPFHRATESGDQFGGAEWLADIIEGLSLHSLCRRFHRSVRRHNDHRDLVGPRAHLAQHLDAGGIPEH